MKPTDIFRQTSFLVPFLVVTGGLSGVLYSLSGVQEVIILCLFVVSLSPVLFSIFRGRFDLFEPIIFYSIFMTMTSIAIFDRLYIQDPFLLHPQWVPWDFSTAFLIISALYLAFFALVIVGYYVRSECLISVPSFMSSNMEHSYKVFRYSGYIYVLIGSIFYIALIGSALDWDLLRLYTTTEPRSDLFSGSNHLLLGARMLYIGYFLWVTSSIINNNRPRLSHLVLAAPIVILFLLLGGRQRAITIFLIVVIMYYYTNIYPLFDTKSGKIRLVNDQLHQKVKILTLPVFGAVAGIVVVFAGIFRSWRNLNDLVDLDMAIKVMTFGIHNNHLDYLLVLFEAVPDHFGYYWGTRVLRVPVNYIPRAIWEDKPVLGIGSELRQVVLPSQAGGRDPSIIGYFYADAGILGVLLGAFIFGFLLRMLYLSLSENGDSPVTLLFYAIVLASVVPNGLGNHALWEVSNHVLLLIPVIALDWFIRHRNEFSKV